MTSNNINATRLRERERKGGQYLGFDTLDEHYQWKQGHPLIIFGEAGSGKSEFLYELLINLSNLYAKKHFLFTPEFGTAAQVLNGLVEKVIGKQVNKLDRYGNENSYHMSDEDYARGVKFVNQHFYISDTTDYPQANAITAKHVYDLADTVSLDFGAFDTISIDPWTQISKGIQSYEEHVGGFLINARMDGQEKKRTSIVVVHPSKSQKIWDKANQRYWIAQSKSNDLHGGETWKRSGDCIIQVYRPDPLIFDCAPNETWITLEKIRPRDAGKLGTVKLYWDGHKQGRYYEIIDGQNFFAEESLARTLTNITSGYDPEAFTEARKNEAPF